jgi:hypothetical protein
MIWDGSWTLKDGCPYQIVKSTEIKIEITTNTIKLRLAKPEIDIQFWSNDKGQVYRTNNFFSTFGYFKHMNLSFLSSTSTMYPHTLFITNYNSTIVPGCRLELWVGDGSALADKIGSIIILKESTCTKLKLFRPNIRQEYFSYSIPAFNNLYQYLLRVGLATEDTLVLSRAPVLNTLVNGTNEPVVNPFSLGQRLILKFMNILPWSENQPSSIRANDYKPSGLLKRQLEFYIKNFCYRMLDPNVEDRTVEINLDFMSGYQVRKQYQPYGVRIELNSKLEIVRLWIPDANNRYIEMPPNDIHALRRASASLVVADVVIKHFTQAHMVVGNELSMKYDSRTDNEAIFMRLFSKNATRLYSKAKQTLLSKGGYLDRVFGLEHNELVRLVADAQKLPLWGITTQLNHDEHLQALQSLLEGPEIPMFIEYHKIIKAMLAEANVTDVDTMSKYIVIGTLCHTLENESLRGLVGRVWKIGTAEVSPVDNDMFNLGYIATVYQSFTLGDDYGRYLPKSYWEVYQKYICTPQMENILSTFGLTLSSVTISPDM